MNSKNAGKPEKKQAHNKNKNMIIGIITTVVLLCCVAGYFAYDLYFKVDYLTAEQIETLKETTTYPNGISVNGINVSGKTYEEAKALVEASETEKIAEMDYTLQNEHGTVHITGTDFVVTFDTEQVLVNALKYGLEGNSFDKMAAKKEIEAGKNFEITMTVDKEATFANIAPKIEPLSLAAVEPAVSLASDKKTLVYTDGSVGYVVDVEALNALIAEQIDAGALVATIVAPTTEAQPTQTIEQVKQHTSLVSQFYTNYIGSSGRRGNIEKGAGIINGLKVEPGQTVSVNDVLGPRVPGKGWFLAPAILNGEHVDELGGGVCQISSTLYNALLMADVTIVQRSPHTIPSTYIAIGRDATISTGGPDLVFKNDNEYPIYIFAIITKTSSYSRLTFKIYGEPLEEGVTISLSSKIVKYIAPTSAMVIVEDPTQYVGYEEVTINRSDGYRVETYKKFVKNGTVIKTETINSYYPPRAGKKIVGTKPLPTPTPPPPTPTPTPTTSTPTSSPEP